VASLKFLVIALDQPGGGGSGGLDINNLLNTTTGFPAMAMGSEYFCCRPRIAMMKTRGAEQQGPRATPTPTKHDIT
jgi:hypothetical protein